MNKTFRDYINGEEFTLYGMGNFGGLIGEHKHKKIIVGENGEYRLITARSKRRGNYLDKDFLDKNYWSHYEFIAFLNLDDARKEAIKRTKTGIEYLERIGKKQEIIDKVKNELNILENGSDHDIIFQP